MKKLLVIAAICLFAIGLISCKSNEEISPSAQSDSAKLNLYEDGVTEYKIIRGQRSSAQVKTIMANLHEALKDRLGSAPLVGDDWVKDEAMLDEDACEILLGDTNRPESIALKEELPQGDSYIIAVEGKRVIIVASDEKVLAEAADVFVKEYVQKNTQDGSVALPADLKLVKTLNYYIREGWEFYCPSPKAGILAPGIYYSGSAFADDTVKETAECARMHLLTKVTRQDFEAYVADMQNAGYTQTLDNTIGENRFACFYKGGCTYYIGYTNTTKEMRVTEDSASTSLDKFAYDTKGDQQIQMYQYGISFCGMFYIFRLSDNSVVLVDGGHHTNNTTTMFDGLMDFLREITGTKKGEKVKIAAWYVSHAHGDHVTVMWKFLNLHPQDLDLQRVMYNIPSYQVQSNGYDNNTTTLKKVIRERYPNTKFLKLHTGQRFNLSDLGVEVLYTHEDTVGLNRYESAAETGGLVQLGLADYNSSSTVIRFTMDGKSIILLGDLNAEGENVMVQNYRGTSVLKSDVVQVSHHCINFMNALYPKIAAPIALFPTSYEGARTGENLAKYNSVMKYVKKNQAYFTTEYTYGFAVVNGEFQPIYKAAMIP